MKRILCVDDEEGIRKVSQRCLRSENVDTLENAKIVVDTAENGKVALAKIMEGTTYDLLITDHNMPEMTGLELLAELQKLQVTFPRLVYSTPQTDSIYFHEQVQALGGLGLVIKPDFVYIQIAKELLEGNSPTLEKYFQKEYPSPLSRT